MLGKSSMTPPLWHLRAARESRWAKYSSLPLQCQTQSPSRTLWSLDANPPLRTPLSTCHPLLRSEVTRVGRGRGKRERQSIPNQGAYQAPGAAARNTNTTTHPLSCPLGDAESWSLRLHRVRRRNALRLRSTGVVKQAGEVGASEGGMGVSC